MSIFKNEIILRLIDDIKLIKEDVCIKFYISSDLPPNADGTCKYDLKTHVFNITIRDTKADIQTLSHELLHVFFDVKLYPKLLDLKNNGTVSEITKEIDNVLIHELIYREQVSRKIDISEFYRTYTNNIMKLNDTDEVHNGNYIRNAFKLLDGYFIAKALDEYKLFTNVLDSFPISKKYFFELRDICNNRKIDAPFYMRKTIIQVLNYLDRAISDDKLQLPSNLQLNIPVGFIPSKRQLDLKLSQLFNFIHLENKIYLVSKREQQLCYALSTQLSVEQISEYLSEDFFNMLCNQSGKDLLVR